MDIFTVICCKICIVCLKRPKVNEKEAEDGPFKKRVGFQIECLMGIFENDKFKFNYL